MISVVTFATYVKIAHDVARQKGVSVDNPAQFMQDLGRVYRENNHSEASESAAKNYLQRVVN